MLNIEALVAEIILGEQANKPVYVPISLQQQVLALLCFSPAAYLRLADDSLLT